MGVEELQIHELKLFSSLHYVEIVDFLPLHPPPCPIFKTLYWNCLSDVLLWKWDDICKILSFSYFLYFFWCLCIIYFNHLLMFSFNGAYVTSLKQFQSHLLFICFMHHIMVLKPCHQENIISRKSTFPRGNNNHNWDIFIINTSDARKKYLLTIYVNVCLWNLCIIYKNWWLYI